MRTIISASALAALLLLNGCMENKWEPTEEFIRQDISERFDFNTIVECPVHIDVDEMAVVRFYGENPTGVTTPPSALYNAYTNRQGQCESTMEIPGEYVGKPIYAVYNGRTVRTIVDQRYGVSINSLSTDDFSGLTQEQSQSLSEQYHKTFTEKDNNISKVQDKAENVKIDIVNDDTEVIVNFLYSGAFDACTLYYYYFPTDPGSKKIYNDKNRWGKYGDEKLPEIFANDRFKIFDGVNEENWIKNNNRVGEEAQLKFYGYNSDTNFPGDGEGTTKFPKGYTIAFFIKSSNPNINTDHKCIYSERWVNTYYYNKNGVTDYHGDQIQAAMFKESSYKALVIGFEDQPLGYQNGDDKCDQDYNDLIFSIKYSPYEDDDKIPDLPVDEKTYDDKESFEGFLLYEDLYPSSGDFDMNDVMVKYKWTKNYTVTVKGNVTTTSMKSIDYEIEPIKPVDSDYALYSNSFWLMVDNNESQNLELLAGPKQIFENQHTAIGNKYTGTITEGAFVGKEKDDIKWSDFNPFIKVPNGYEVHLCKKKASQAGLNDRLSEYCKNYIVENGIWPFAINIPLRFSEDGTPNQYPNVREDVRIDKLYPNFLDWLNSKGAEHQDWYTQPAN